MLIGRRFEVLAELGQGGMGVVYRVADTWQNGNAIALKRIRSEQSATREQVLRFQEEFRAMTRLRHPNTIEVYDFGVLPDQSCYITMELVEGRSLAEWIRTGPLPIASACSLLVELLQALDFVHSRNYVHRDIKPDNIRIRHDGTLKLLDYGLMDPLGTLVGASFAATVGYVAPEVLRGGVLSAATDLYSVGCLAHVDRMLLARESICVIRGRILLDLLRFDEAAAELSAVERRARERAAISSASNLRLRSAKNVGAPAT